MSKAALWATSTQSAENCMKPGTATAWEGAAATIASVMPVRTWIIAGMGTEGRTRVWNSPSTSPPQTFTAPISVICASDPAPVVSRSTTQKAVVRRWDPRSSKLGWESSAGRCGVIMLSKLPAGHDKTPPRAGLATYSLGMS